MEDPLLLHPYFDEPRGHLGFSAMGGVEAINGSELGEKSIETYDLNRSVLVEERKGRMAQGKDALLAALCKLVIEGTSVDESMEPYTGPSAPFSEAVKVYIDRKRDSFSKDMAPCDGGKKTNA